MRKASVKRGKQTQSRREGSVKERREEKKEGGRKGEVREKRRNEEK